MCVCVFVAYMRVRHAVTVVSVVQMGIGRELGLRHVMKRGGHCCVDKPGYFFISRLDGRPNTACGYGGHANCMIGEERAEG